MISQDKPNISISNFLVKDHTISLTFSFYIPKSDEFYPYFLDLTSDKPPCRLPTVSLTGQPLNVFIDQPNPPLDLIDSNTFIYSQTLNSTTIVSSLIEELFLLSNSSSNLNFSPYHLLFNIVKALDLFIY